MEERKKVIYIAGPITGVDKYWEAFERVEDDLSSLGYIPLSPAHLPSGMTNDQYMKIDFAMINCADAVVFLPDYARSDGASLERQYCKYTGKPGVVYKVRDRFLGADYAREVSQAFLKTDLEEALSE